MNTSAVREYLLDERRAWVETALACADAVADGWDGDTTTDRTRVTDIYREYLDQAGVLDAAPDVLGGCVTAAGEHLAATPVAAPPYVVTSEGLLLRATLDTRLLVRVRVFELKSGDGSPRYARVGTTPEQAVVVETTE